MTSLSGIVPGLPYEIVTVTPDTDEWLEERRKSIGASEVAAVMGLSRYSTALEVYKSKQGIADNFDPLLGWIGHESEPIIERWVSRWSGVPVTLEPGFMARSTARPELHATFDRISRDPFTTWQFKTAHQYAGHHWDEGVPTDIRVQVQAEMFVAGTDRAAVVVWIGGREFRLYWEPRDNVFIDDHMVPALVEFWGNLRAGVAPPPQNVTEAVETWPGEVSSQMELDDDTFDLLEELTVSRSDRKAMEEREDEIKLELAPLIANATELYRDGRLAYTYRPQKGRTSFDREGLERDHPDVLAAYTRQGSPQRIIRYVKPKEEK